MKKLLQNVRPRINRASTAVVVAGSALLAGAASAQTAPATVDGGAMVTSAQTNIVSMLQQGGPAVFGLVGIGTGIVFLINRVRSLG